MGNVLTPLTSPTKFINLTAHARNSDKANIGIGVDGLLYRCPAGDTTFTVDSTDGYTDVAQYWCAYGVADTFAIQTDGTFVSNTANWVIDEKIIGYFPLGPVCRACILQGESGQLYGLYSDFTINTNYLGSYTVTGTGIYLFPLLPTEIASKVIDAAAVFNSYDAQGIILLTSDGKIYTYSAANAADASMLRLGLPNGVREDAPALVSESTSTKFKRIYGLSTNGSKSGFTALDENDNLWLAADTGNDITGSLHTFGIWGAGYKSGFVHMYQTDGAYALKTNGEVWGTIGSKVTGESEWTKIDVGGLLKSLGGLAGNQNAYGVPNLIPVF